MYIFIKKNIIKLLSKTFYKRKKKLEKLTKISYLQWMNIIYMAKFKLSINGIILNYLDFKLTFSN